MSGPEEKWHNELNSRLSVDFWNKSWKSLSQLKMNNDLKWIQYQILRNILKTNVIVSKFVPLVNPSCSFCNDSQESILHLMYDCRHVQSFWSAFNDFLANNTIPSLDVARTNILFGVKEEKINSLQNTLILLGKKYVWTSKFKGTAPRINIFQNILREYLNNLKMVHSILGKDDDFENTWGLLYLLLLQ